MRRGRDGLVGRRGGGRGRRRRAGAPGRPPQTYPPGHGLTPAAAPGSLQGRADGGSGPRWPAARTPGGGAGGWVPSPPPPPPSVAGAGQCEGCEHGPPAPSPRRSHSRGLMPGREGAGRRGGGVAPGPLPGAPGSSPGRRGTEPARDRLADGETGVGGGGGAARGGGGWAAGSGGAPRVRGPEGCWRLGAPSPPLPVSLSLSVVTSGSSTSEMLNPLSAGGAGGGRGGARAARAPHPPRRPASGAGGRPGPVSLRVQSSTLLAPLPPSF